MRKSELHPDLQKTCVPIPGKTGCFAVVPGPVPSFVHVPSCHSRLALARRELEALAATVAANLEHADLVMHMLNRRETVDSSQIEGTQTGFDGLLIHEIEAGTPSATVDQDADTTLAYLQAYLLGSQRVAEQGQAALDTRLIRDLHAHLLAGQERFEPGKFRDRQNFVGLRYETARYIPPPPSEVPRLMDELTGLLQYRPDGTAEVSILMRAAIAHAQFEAIHPFFDGNGRVGRLLLPLMFKAAGEPPIHLATFLKVRQRDYYDALWQMQTRLDWAPWLALFCETVIASCRHTVQLFAHLQAIGERWKQLLHAQARRKHATIWRVTELLLGQPVVTVGLLTDRLGVTFPAANDAVRDLVAMDILRPMNPHRRNRAFQAHEVLNALYTGLDAALEDAVRLAE